MKFSVFIALIFAAVFAQADACVPSSTNCDYYSCIEKELQCGPQGYPVNFGQRLCERYLDHEASSSEALKRWYPQVRECLQAVVAKLDSVRDCDDLRVQAFQKHFDCYVETDFCSLSWQDKFEVLRLAGVTALSPLALSTSMQIEQYCLSHPK
jgi:hypothetical protein